MPLETQAQASAIIEGIQREADSLPIERRQNFLKLRIEGRIRQERSEMNHQVADEIARAYDALSRENR